MTPPLPAWLRNADPDADRLLVAAWLLVQGEDDAAVGIARSVNRSLGRAQLAEVAELIGCYRDCQDDPRTYAYVRYGLTGASCWDTWAGQECEDVLDRLATLVEAMAVGRQLAGRVA